jgi:hypothetical protein
MFKTFALAAILSALTPTATHNIGTPAMPVLFEVVAENPCVAPVAVVKEKTEKPLVKAKYKVKKEKVLGKGHHRPHKVLHKSHAPRHHHVPTKIPSSSVPLSLTTGPPCG